MVCVPKIGSGLKSHPRRTVPIGDPLSARTTKPSGESGHGAPLTVAVNVTRLHAVDGFEDDFSAVLVGTPSANAGAAARPPPTTSNAANTTTRIAQPLAFISIP